MAKPDRIFASELLEREVMDLREGQIVGAVTDFNVTREGVVTQLGVLPLQWYRGGHGIAPAAVTNVTRERVSIDDSSMLQDFAPDGDSSLSAMLGDNLYGKPVLQSDGELLGNLADFAFDLSDGKITDLVVFGEGDKRQKISIEQIQTIGKSYIVVARGGAPSEVQPGPKPAASSAAAEGAASGSVKKGKAAKAAPAPAGEPQMAGLAPSDGATPAAEVSTPTPPRLPPADEESSGAATAAEPMMQTQAEASEDAPPIVDEAGQLGFGMEPAAAETDQLASLGLTAFDRRKAEYLLGKPAHRDLRRPSGELIAARGDALEFPAVMQVVEAGLLNSVFLELTQTHH